MNKINFTTIKELYDWAVANKAENLPVGIGFQDGGGSYGGDTFDEGVRCSIDGDVTLSISLEKSGDYDYILIS